MELELGKIIAAAWTAIGIPVLIYAFRWLGSAINKNKAFAGSMIDDQVIAALRTAIANIGNKTADAIKANPKDWKRAAKKELRESAKDEAILLLDEKARQRFRELGDAGLDVLIRKLVDDRNKAKST